MLFLPENAMIYNNKELPSGWALLILGDGFKALIKTVFLNIKYPGRVHLIGRLPAITKILGIFVKNGTIRKIPKGADIKKFLISEIETIDFDESCAVMAVLARGKEYDDLINTEQGYFESEFIIYPYRSIMPKHDTTLRRKEP